MLLRMFVMLYDLEIIEEDAFISWKEDVNDEHPGKGRALFQVCFAKFTVCNFHPMICFDNEPCI